MTQLQQHFDLLATAPKGVARLRELILTLAVQGKLVPQDPQDEPASVLLERIREEKARLVKEGKIRKEKPLAGIAEEEKPFALPGGWEWVRLQNLTELITSGSRDWAKYHADQGAVFIGMGNLSRGSYKLRLDRIQYVAPPISGEGTRTRLEAFDLLVSITGDVGMLGLIPPNFGEAYINQHTCLIRWLPMLRSQFFPIQLLAPFAQSQFNSPQRGIKNSFRLSDASGILIALPPLAEQARIVARVEELMAVCDALEAKGKLEVTQHERLCGGLFEALVNSESAHALAENWQRVAGHFDVLLDRVSAVDRLEQTILQLAVRGLLVPQNPADEPASVLLQKIRNEKDRLIAAGQLKRDKPLPPISDEEKPFELPEGWEWAYLSEACLLITDGTHQTPRYVETGRPFLSAQNIKPFSFIPQVHRFVSEEDFWSLRRGRTPKRGDVLMTRVGAMIGEAAVIDTDLEFAFYVSLALLSIPKPFFNPDFLVICLNSPHGTTHSTQKTLGRGVSAGNLNLSFIRSFVTPIPPLPEQSRIVARVAELRALCAQLRERLAATTQTQSRLAEALLAGAL